MRQKVSIVIVYFKYGVHSLQYIQYAWADIVHLNVVVLYIAVQKNQLVPKYQEVDFIKCRMSIISYL